jgi:hypothetical protein
MNMNLKVLNVKYFLAVKKSCKDKTKGCCQSSDVLIMSFLTYCSLIILCFKLYEQVNDFCSCCA